MTFVPDTEVEMEEFSDTVAFEDVSEGEKTPTMRIYDIKPTDFVRYAGASGDFNPLHYDLDFAQEQGYDDIFAMGMMNTGFLSHLVTKWIGLDPVERFRTQFEELVFPGDDLTIYGIVESVDHDTNTVNCDLVVENQDGDAVISGDLEAVLPSRED